MVRQQIHNKCPTHFDFLCGNISESNTAEKSSLLEWTQSSVSKISLNTMQEFSLHPALPLSGCCCYRSPLMIWWLRRINCLWMWGSQKCPWEHNWIFSLKCCVLAQFFNPMHTTTLVLTATPGMPYCQHLDPPDSVSRALWSLLFFFQLVPRFIPFMTHFLGLSESPVNASACTST